MHVYTCVDRYGWIWYGMVWYETARCKYDTSIYIYMLLLYVRCHFCVSSHRLKSPLPPNAAKFALPSSALGLGPVRQQPRNRTGLADGRHRGRLRVHPLVARRQEVKGGQSELHSWFDAGLAWVALCFCFCWCCYASLLVLVLLVMPKQDNTSQDARRTGNRMNR